MYLAIELFDCWSGPSPVYLCPPSVYLQGSQRAIMEEVSGRIKYGNIFSRVLQILVVTETLLVEVVGTCPLIAKRLHIYMAARGSFYLLLSFGLWLTSPG